MMLAHLLALAGFGPAVEFFSQQLVGVVGGHEDILVEQSFAFCSCALRFTLYAIR
jgi:hypothetical protein